MKRRTRSRFSVRELADYYDSTFSPEEKEKFNEWCKKIENRLQQKDERLQEAARIIEAGYRVRAKLLHPDRDGDEEQMINLNLAVELLRDAIQKTE